MSSHSTAFGLTAALCAALCLGTSPAFAQDAAAGGVAPAINSGDTAWVLTATALVLFMTLPGLALFYGGLVRAKNYLSVLMKVLSIAALASLVWIIAGYSIAFGDEGLWWGGLSKAFSNVGTDAVTGTIPENVFLAFQMTFAIITPALIVGAFVERVKFLPVMIFTALWVLLVYAPITHWIWGGGYLAQTFETVDFAGGLVVHATAGISALIYVALLGPRKGFPSDMSVPHRPGMVMIGASMLWVGWFGFNGGSQLAADGGAGMALLVTHIAASTATLVWIGLEGMQSRKPTLVGAATGTIAGLATVTPAAGVLGPGGAILMGLAGGLVCYAAVNLIRVRLKFDDSLDVFAVHGVGGMLGILLLPFLSATVLGGTGDGVFTDQLMSLLIVVGWTAVATTAILLLLKVTLGLRVTEEQEYEGLDTSLHGESAYN